MLKDLSTRLSKTIEQKRLKKKLEHDLHNIEAELQDQSARLARLRTQMEKEEVDVEKLERTSLTALFYSVLGRGEQQLEKERQEFLAAQLQYQQTKHQVEYLERERDYLLRQLEKLADVESEYESLLSEKEDFLRQENKAEASDLLEISDQRASLASEIKEISEAIYSGKMVISGLDQVIGSLESAKNWGTWDMIGGGFISTAIKHSRIDDARDAINTVQTNMSQFKRELADVGKSIELKINISEFEYFADFFFDGLIMDWVVQSRIAESLERTEKVKNEILQSVRNLEGLKRDLLNKQRDLEEKRAQILERF